MSPFNYAIQTPSARVHATPNYNVSSTFQRKKDSNEEFKMPSSKALAAIGSHINYKHHAEGRLGGIRRPILFSNKLHLDSTTTIEQSLDPQHQLAQLTVEDRTT
jgi:hypothetical protein